MLLIDEVGVRLSWMAELIKIPESRVIEAYPSLISRHFGLNSWTTVVDLPGFANDL